eukprot:6456756-Amphidinium_carterae.1
MGPMAPLWNDGDVLAKGQPRKSGGPCQTHWPCQAVAGLYQMPCFAVFWAPSGSQMPCFAVFGGLKCLVLHLGDLKPLSSLYQASI